jgi:hypothetical protein
MNTYATIEEPSEAVISVLFALRPCNWFQWEKLLAVSEQLMVFVSTEAEESALFEATLQQ